MSDFDNVKIPRLMISSFSSNSGKTLVTCALLRFFQKRKIQPAAFKCGPDFIDPLFHSKVLGLKTYNTDLFLSGENLTLSLFAENFINSGSDLAVIEGAMGYYDGLGGKTSLCSASEIAALTETPVVLVVDASASAFSLIPLIKGFCNYKNGSMIKAVILNKISPALYNNIKEKIEEECSVKVLGFLPKSKELQWPSRHLGLFLPEEILEFQKQIDRAEELLAESLDFDGLKKITENSSSLLVNRIYATKKILSDFSILNVTVAIAYDEAFCFYYQDNLSLLKAMGAKLVFFSPLHDKKIPECQALLLGGGYPELYARSLEENISIKTNIKKLLTAGMPCLAECGGFMYLQRSIKCEDEKEYKMCDVLPGESRYTGHLTRFGYASFSYESYNIKGHEFHYFDSDNNGSLFTAVKSTGGRTWKCIQRFKNTFAGFPHLFYWSCPEFIYNFLQIAAQNKL